MYKEIDALVKAIYEDQIFQNYLESEALLHDEKMILLLSRHASLQEEYLKLKKFSQYISIDGIKKDLLDVKKEMMENSVVQRYYQSYYALNDLLEEVTKIVFDNISDEIDVDVFSLEDL